MGEILKADIAINGSPKIIISTDTDLGREILKSKFNKIEVTIEVTKVLDKVIPEGSIVISFDSTL